MDALLGNHRIANHCRLSIVALCAVAAMAHGARAGVSPASTCAVGAAPPPSRVVTSGAELAAHVQLSRIGNTAISSRAVLDGIAALGASPPVDGAGRYIQDNLERDLLLIARFYWDLGYANVKVGAPDVDLPRHAISIPITEGARFTISTVHVAGDLIGTIAQHHALLQTHAGHTFSRTVIADDREHLSTYYQDLGYAFASVLPWTHVDVEHHQIGLTFEITRGKLAHLGRIGFRGNKKTPSAALLRDLQLTEGEPFSATKLATARCRILAARPAMHVTIATVPGQADDLVDLHVDISE